jgi:tetratricopeptide (TPR) repeat protein
MSEGFIDKAIGHYRIALQLEPDYTEAHYGLGLAFLAKGLVDMARREFGKVLELDPGHERAKEHLLTSKP